jgi:hypothetical protein
LHLALALIREGMTYLTSDLFDVLIKLAPLVKLLVELEPVNASDLPAEHMNDLKQLETLGLVFRRNSHACTLQKQRLIKIIERESRYVSTAKRSMCLSAYSSLIQLKESQSPHQLHTSEQPIIDVPRS